MMLKFINAILFLTSVFFLTPVLADAKCTLAVELEGAITMASFDYLKRAETVASERGCGSLFVKINTPGGDLQSTRMIVEKILASPIPYLCLISPSGGHAGSAGAIIMMACHVSAGLPATNLGAATPILASGQQISEDLRKKMINDTKSWLEGVTKLRGRNLKFAEEIITEAKAVSADEAVKLGALDFVATNEEQFLELCQEREVLIGDQQKQKVTVGAVQDFAPDLRKKVLGFVADPEMAYMIFMGSLALLYFEITHPGTIAPGVIGGIGLVLSMVALHKMDVQWGGLALIFLGIAFLIAELFVPSFGILGVGGIVSFVVGSLFLFDTAQTGYAIPLYMILGVASVIAAFFLGVGYLALSTIRKRKDGMDGDFKVSKAIVVSVENDGKSGQIEVLGETWRFESTDPLKLDEEVQVLERVGLTLKVKSKLT
ncbi:MAG: NfeD family protein [Pseudobdellovibrionaceae bacterium]